MQNSATSKKVIIIGATSGIGKELAMLFAKAGNKVAITGRRAALLDELQSQFPKNIISSCFDVTGNENISRLKTIISELGGLDIFIYNAGYGEPSKTLDWQIEKVSNDINVNGFAEMTNHIFNYFQQHGHGQIVATSSIASIRGNSFAPAYSAGKAYMSNYMEGLHIKAKKLKLPISITDIQPGFIDTKMAKGNGRFWVAPPQKAAGQMFRAILQKRFRVYITKRWRLIAWLMKWMPGLVYDKVG